MAAKGAKVAIKKELDNNLNDFNYPLLGALRANDRKNLFKPTSTSFFHKTGFPLFDYYFGALINIHNEAGRIIGQSPRIGQGAGTFNQFLGDSGTGKALPVSTRIPTPDGYTLMGDIKIGDQIFGSDGKPVMVTGVYPQGMKDVWRIVLDDGRDCKCCSEHLWNIKMRDTLNDTITTTEEEKVEELKDVEYITVSIDDMFGDGPFIHWPTIARFEIYLPPSPMGEFIDKYPRIINIENLGYPEEMVCISVDAEDQLYLIEDHIVTHNTTITVQIAANIIRPYRNSTIHHYDIENRFDYSRAETITRLPIYMFEENGDRQKYFLHQGQQSLEDIQATIVKIWAEKMKLKEEISVNTGSMNEFNKEVVIMEPTIIIIDSISQVISATFSPDNAKDVSDMQDLRSNTAGARDAKTLKGFLKEVCPLLKEANIIIFGINHITGNMSMNIMAGPKKQQNYLKADEAIPGGKNATYSSFNMVKMTAKTSLGDSFSIDSDGFAGHLVMFEPIKSSTNQSGNNSHGISFDMVLDKRHGFDTLRSLILYGREKGIIEGNKSRYKFKDDDSFTFSFRTIHKERTEKPIWECVRKYIMPELETHLSYIEPDDVVYDENVLLY